MSQLRDPFDSNWMEFISRRAEAMIFHHPAWMKLLSDTYGYRPFVFGVRGTDGRYCAGVPLMEVNSPLTGRRWVSLPFSDFCSLLCDDESVQRQITDDLLSLTAAQNIHNLELRWRYPDHASLTSTSDCVFHELDLEPDCDHVLAGLHPMHRRNIKTANSKGVRIVRGDTREQLREYYDLHLVTRRRQGVPSQPWKFFEGLANLFEQGLGFLLLAYIDQQCIAGAVFLHWQKTLTYKYGASLPDELQVRPNNLIMWTAIRWGCENEFKKMDFGRTDLANEGLRTFKSRWGGREFRIPYTHLASHGKKATNGKLMVLLSNVIQRSPLWFCRISGQVLYKHFG